MKRRQFLSLLPLAVVPGALSAATTGDATFRIGVAPHSSARVIVEMYQPLRQFLEKALERPAEIVTAADFTEFARRAVAQQYDLAITTGHQARLLQTDAAYLPLLTYQADFRAVALVVKDAPYRKPADLAGTTVFGLSPASLVTLWGQHWLYRNDVQATTMKYVSAADSVVQLLIRGEGAVAFTSLANFQGLAPAVQAQVRVFDESVPLAGRVYVLNKRHRARQDRIGALLWAFAETPAARQYFAKYKLGGYRKLEARELNEMDPYANEVRQVLQAPAR